MLIKEHGENMKSFAERVLLLSYKQWPSLIVVNEDKSIHQLSKAVETYSYIFVMCGMKLSSEPETDAQVHCNCLKSCNLGKGFLSWLNDQKLRLLF